MDEVAVEVENIVVTANLNHNLDLKGVAKAAPGSTYEPKRFPGLVYKLKRPTATVLIFASGRMVCTGAKSEDEAEKAVGKVVETLRGRGFIIMNKPTTTVQNIVVSADLKKKVNLDRFVHTLGETMYEPEKFPGLVYRLRDTHISFLIFSTGRVVCVGAKTKEEAYGAIRKLQEQLDLVKLST
jgi:transcription initiation factor TFIID TATA-box-binding protein